MGLSVEALMRVKLVMLPTPGGDATGASVGGDATGASVVGDTTGASVVVTGAGVGLEEVGEVNGEKFHTGPICPHCAAILKVE